MGRKSRSAAMEFQTNIGIQFNDGLNGEEMLIEHDCVVFVCLKMHSTCSMKTMCVLMHLVTIISDIRFFLCMPREKKERVELCQTSVQPETESGFVTL